ncbi:unnamed protein product [Gulo gulo]|uniref:Uncharacterized protein n=1 Tax=Gulo gulo TaxID=48420 RepID=A0A9X9Q408_GULGU|nr:unnamed protein product [Gulo gulo]
MIFSENAYEGLRTRFSRQQSQTVWRDLHAIICPLMCAAPDFV